MAGSGNRSAEERQKMASEGRAMQGGSYPIGDRDELEKAIKAVGRGGAAGSTIRQHIMKNAARLGLSNMIPDTWNPDGSLKASISPAEIRAGMTRDWLAGARSDVLGTQ